MRQDYSGFGPVHRFGFLTVLAVLAGASYAQESPEKLMPKSLQGRWQLVFVTQGGEQRDRKACLAANVIFEIKGDTYALTAGGKAIEKGKLTLDTEKSPARVDLLIEEGKDKGKKQLVITRLRAGKLEWCAGPAGGGRPKEFASEKGSEDNYAQFERLQK